MKKRVLSLALALLMVLSLVPMSALAAEGTLSGDGSASNPYLISSADDLKAFRDRVNAGENPACAKLTADIDLEGEEWTPITSLIGYLDGDGHTISNLTLRGGTGTYSSPANIGLIGELNGSIINLNVDNVDITEGIGNYNNVGALVGKIEDGSTSKIDNCTVGGTITGKDSGYSPYYIGGLVGYNATNLAINNCISKVEMTCGRSGYIGGLLGSAIYAEKISISNSAVIGNLTSDNYGGGFVGFINGGNPELDVNNSLVAGKLSGTRVGGIAYFGYVSSITVTLTDFYFNSELNKDASSYSKFKMLPTSNSEKSYTGTVNKKTTSELKALSLDGFAVREGKFDGYPVPVYTKAEPLPLPKITVSATVAFDGTEDGTVTVKGPSGETVAPNESKTYTLTEVGEYTYTVTGMEQYKDVEGSFKIGKGDDGQTKTISVPHEYKDVDLTGTGTEEDPIQLSTALELRTFANKVNNGEPSNAYVELKNNIIVPGSWTPLGKNATSPFKGHFDGDGHSVTITVDDPNLNYFGFFGCLEGAVVENLTVEGSVYCSEPYAFVGGLAARARGNVVLSNCVNNASMSSLARGSAGVGGLVGGYDDNVDYKWEDIRMTVDGCTNNGTISVTGSNTNAMVGGLVGANQNCVQVKDSQNTATINAPGCTVGGLLGEAGYQTGDFVPSIADSKNTGTLIGAEGKTNNLYGKGTIRSGNVTNSGDNAYTGGSESKDELLVESQKYQDVAAVPATADIGDKVEFLKAGENAGDGITVTYSLGERDTNRDYLTVDNGVLRLAKKNTTGKVIEATATITWSNGEKTLSKPVTVNIYPAATGETSARKTLMDSIAATYTSSSSDWVVFDMAVYEKCGFGTNTTDKNNYLNLTANELAGTSPLVTDRAKAEIILAALGVNSTQLKPLDGELYSNAAKLAEMNLGSSHYAGPWVLLAEQAGQVKLSDSQRNSMISLLTDSQNLGSDGLFFTKWGNETYADPDTIGTALAALAKYNTSEYPAVQEFITKAIAGLSKAQNSNGSYGNVNSDAMVITGLTAVGIDPATDNRFVKGGCSLADALLLYVNDAKNGFTTTYSSGTQGEKAQALATEQGFRALVTLEQFESLNGSTKSYNVYTQTAKVSNGGSTTVTTPDKPNEGHTSTDKGSTDTGSDSGSTGGSTTNWISTTVTIKPDSSTIWYAGTVRVEEGATVEQALKQAAGNAGMALDIKDHYLRSVTYQGNTLGQFDQGPNSGWLYKVNGKAPNVGMGDYTLTTGGDSITLYYTADYTKEDDLDISKPSGGGGGGTTTTPTEPTTPTCPFTDIQTHWAKDAVTTAWSKGWMKGVTDTTFVPENQMTRAMLVTVLYRMDGEPTAGSVERGAFHDVASDTYYAKAVAWAAENGIVKGVSEDSFAPNASITREQLAAILYRYANYKKMDTTQGGMALHEFDDENAISEYAKDAMEWAVNVGLLKGVGEAKLSPQGTATRAQVATMLVRFDGLNTKQ